jgi:hypothetical protein
MIIKKNISGITQNQTLPLGLRAGRGPFLVGLLALGCGIKILLKNI